MTATAAPATIDTREAIEAETREVQVGAIDSAVREFEVSIRWLQLRERGYPGDDEVIRSRLAQTIRDIEAMIRYLQLRKRELSETASPPFVRVSPPKEGRA